MYFRRPSFVDDRFIFCCSLFLRIIFNACCVAVTLLMTIDSYYELLLHVLRFVYRDFRVMGSTSSSFSSLRRVPFLFLVFYFVLLRLYFMIAWWLTLLFFQCYFVCRVPFFPAIHHFYFC